jgi:hypothetical protein
MEIVWLGIGFLVGASLWMPVVIAAQVELRVVRLLTAQAERSGR